MILESNDKRFGWVLNGRVCDARDMADLFDPPTFTDESFDHAFGTEYCYSMDEDCACEMTLEKIMPAFEDGEEHCKESMAEAISDLFYDATNVHKIDDLRYSLKVDNMTPATVNGVPHFIVNATIDYEGGKVWFVEV